MSSEFSKWFAEAIGLNADSRADAGQRTSPKKMEEESEAKGYIKNGIVYDAQGNMIDELPLEDPEFPFDPVDLLGYIGYGASLGRLYRAGSEIVFKPKSGQIRIAPFGNRRGDPDHGNKPHYHVGRKDSSGKVRRDQGVDRHRPWESRETDKHWWDKF